MTEQKYQHEMIVTDAGFPFKLFRFEGYNGKYIRDKHWHRSIEIFAVQKGEQFIWFSHSERAYDAQVACLIFRMYEVYQEKADGYEFEILSMFYELLHILIKKYRKQEVQDELIKSNQQLNRLGVITTYLKEHYTEDISLEKLAGIFGYSPSYLSKMFARYAGINYKDYLQNVRLEHAITELEETDHQIGEIALAHGFANSKAFTNLFRKRYGMLTSEYRKQLADKRNV